MASRTLTDSIEFTYADDDRDPTVPYFEGIFEIDYRCSDRGDCYDVDIESISLQTGLVWFGDRGHEIKPTTALEQDALHWFEQQRTCRELVADKIRAAIISHFERMVD